MAFMILLVILFTSTVTEEWTVSLGIRTITLLSADDTAWKVQLLGKLGAAYDQSGTVQCTYPSGMGPECLGRLQTPISRRLRCLADLAITGFGLVLRLRSVSTAQSKVCPPSDPILPR